MEEIMDKAKVFTKVSLDKMRTMMLTLTTTVPTFHLAKDLILSNPSLSLMNDPNSSLIPPTSMLPCPISLLQSTLLIQLGRLNGISVHIIKCEFLLNIDVFDYGLACP